MYTFWRWNTPPAQSCSAVQISSRKGICNFQWLVAVIFSHRLKKTDFTYDRAQQSSHVWTNKWLSSSEEACTQKTKVFLVSAQSSSGIWFRGREVPGKLWNFWVIIVMVKQFKGRAGPVSQWLEKCPVREGNLFFLFWAVFSAVCWNSHGKSSRRVLFSFSLFFFLVWNKSSADLPTAFWMSLHSSALYPIFL